MAKGPDLKKYMNRRILLRLSGNRTVSGVLSGYDAFMNIVLENAVHEVSATEQEEVGTVVLRGSCIVQFEVISG